MTLVTLGSNIFSLRAQRALSRADDLQSTSALRLSSGSRINSASDDAAGLAVADSLRVKQRLFSGAIRNTNDGISMLNIIDGSLANQSDIVMRLAELAEQSASGTLTNSQRGSLDKEYQSLVAEFTRVADGTTFNGLNLLRSQRGDGVSSMLLQLGITGASTSQVSVTTQDTSRFSGVLTKSMLNSSADGEIDAVDFDVIISTLSGANPYDLHPGASTFTVRGSDGRDHELLMYAMDYADAANFGST